MPARRSTCGSAIPSKFWQAYNRKASSPFRETNYQPEPMLILPINKSIAGLDFSYANLGLVHQSNGQTSTLSRSWNRVYAELGMEPTIWPSRRASGNAWTTASRTMTISTSSTIMGHGDCASATATTAMSSRPPCAATSQEARFRAGGWAFPCQANLKGYLQLFSGYGQSLIDYNYSQKSIGAGFLVDY